LRLVYNAHFTPATREFKPEKATRHRVNHEITAREIRVVDEEGKMLGVMTRNDAIKKAEEKELDLVEIAPQAVPPVCKIIDYGKFSYEQHKREKAQRKHQIQQQMKEIRFKWRTDVHDFNFKTRHAREFIEEGHKVKATVMFRGREIIHQEIGVELLERFVAALDDIAKLDQTIKSEGKFLSVVLTQDKTKKKK
jgi:translation initiation factor IF-3